MRLLSCRIENFGKLSHFTYEFREGISSITEDNGFGKSTFCAFLLAMLYGFEGDRKRGLNSERTFYEPWQGGVYGGSVSFETQGMRYRFDRTFGKKESEDTFELYDLSTNLPSTDFSVSIGEELFKIDRNSFMKTAFIGQDALLTEATDHVNALIGNLSEDTNDISSYEKTDARLKSWLDGRTPRKKTGDLYKLNEKIRELKTLEPQGPVLAYAMRSLAGKTDETDRQITLLREEEKAAQKTFETAALAAQKRQILERHDGLRTALFGRRAMSEEYRRVFPKSIPEQYEFLSAIHAGSSLKQDLQRIEENRFSEEEEERFREYCALFTEGLPSGEDIAEAMEAENELEKIRKALKDNALTPVEKKRFQMLSKAFDTGGKDPVAKAKGRRLTGIILMAAAAVILAFSLFLIPAGTWKTLCIGTTGVMFAVGLILLLTVRVREAEEEKEEWEALHEKALSIDEEALLKKAEELDALLKGFLHRFGMEDRDERYADDLLALSQKAADYEKLLKKKAIFDQAGKEAEFSKNVLDAFFGKLGINEEEDVTAQLNSLLTARSSYINAKKNEEDAERQLSEFEKTCDTEAIAAELREISAEDPEEAKQAISAVTEALEAKRKERNALTRQTEDLREQKESWEEGHERLVRMEEEYETELQKYRLVEKTRELLGASKDAMTNRYSAPLLKAFGDYYEQLTGSRDGNYSLNAKTELSYASEGRQRAVASFSKGYQDLLSLCLRFSFIDAMYPEEKPFVILDDPFTNLDTQKTAYALRFLEQAAEKYQLVYLTCHESRAYKGEDAELDASGDAL